MMDAWKAAASLGQLTTVLAKTPTGEPFISNLIGSRKLEEQPMHVPMHVGAKCDATPSTIPIPTPKNNDCAGEPSRRDGRFLPGHSGNPSGRPKVVAHIQQLARQHAPEALAALVEIATSGVSESARVAAACALLDRGFGKPMSATQIIPPPRDLRDLSNEELDEAIDALQRKICAQTEALESYSQLAEADDEQRQQSLKIP